MGYSVSYFAFRNRKAEDVFREISLRPSGQFEEIAESEVVSCPLPDHWCLIFANDCESPLLLPATLAKISQGAEVVTCAVEEHVMFSSASSWSNGRQIWSVSHDAQRAADHLQCEGVLPAKYFAIAETLKKQQQGDEDVDHYFDIPVSLCEAVIGYRYDRYVEGNSYQIMIP